MIVVDTTLPQLDRPRIHFTPERNWMNDPNGLVHHDGVHHLFFQHNPTGIEHGNVGWGHATSPDLARWTELPVALHADADGEVFSGSVVFDEQNASGLGTADRPPLVAVYTQAAKGHQSQAVASSTDGGLTWVKYPGNPVLDRRSADFRDPKVFRYAGPGGVYWVMVAVEAEDRRVVLYRSDDLLDWSFLSSYGPAGPVGGVWECPDLFPLGTDGDPEDVWWVLLVSLNPGGVAGGSGTHVVVGDFDGTRFTPTRPLPAQARDADGRWPVQDTSSLEQFAWLDHGRDCYAGVTFSGLPDGDRTLIAWMDNWDYARERPASSWKGAMTLPRRLDLVTVDGQPVLRQRVIGPAGLPEVDITTTVSTATGAAGHEAARRLTVPDVARITLAVDLDDDATGIEAAIRHDAERGTGVVLRYDRSSSWLTVERGTPAGFPSGFATTNRVRVPAPDGRIALEIWLDASSVEVFTGDGLASLTTLAVFADDDHQMVLRATHAAGREVRIVGTV